VRAVGDDGLETCHHPAGEWQQRRAALSTIRCGQLQGWVDLRWDGGIVINNQFARQQHALVERPARATASDSIATLKSAEGQACKPQGSQRRPWRIC